VPPGIFKKLGKIFILEMNFARPFKSKFFVILNEVKDLNLLKIRDASRRSE